MWQTSLPVFFFDFRPLLAILAEVLWHLFGVALGPHWAMSWLESNLNHCQFEFESRIMMMLLGQHLAALCHLSSRGFPTKHHLFLWQLTSYCSQQHQQQFQNYSMRETTAKFNCMVTDTPTDELIVVTLCLNQKGSCNYHWSGLTQVFTYWRLLLSELLISDDTPWMIPP